MDLRILSSESARDVQSQTGCAVSREPGRSPKCRSAVKNREFNYRTGIFTENRDTYYLASEVLETLVAEKKAERKTADEAKLTNSGRDTCVSTGRVHPFGMIVRLDHLQLAMPVGDETKARAFFRDALGMVELEKPEPLASRGGCWFAAGSVMVHLGVEKGFSPQRKAHPAFCVSDIDGLAARLLSKGFDVVWDDALPERKRFYTSDPFGNRLEIIRDGDGFTQK